VGFHVSTINNNSFHETKTEKMPLKPISNNWKDPNTQIFVGVSHFRDIRCANTLDNIFKKAKYPERVFVGKLQI